MEREEEEDGKRGRLITSSEVTFSLDTKDNNECICTLFRFLYNAIGYLFNTG